MDEEVQRSHYEALKGVLSMLRSKGLTLNKAKCNFGVRQISFFGYIFSAEGMGPDPEKVKTLTEALDMEPTTKEEVASFLGFLGYNQQFIENYATLVEPLRRILAKDKPFEWGREQRRSYRSAILSLREATMLSYFDPEKHTFLHTDASGVGCHAQLSQLDDVGCVRPIGFACCAFNSTEKKYSQIEREAVGMQFGSHRFQLFLFGAPFTHYIDPESLKLMMDNPKKDAPARIDRIRLKLQGYDARIKIVPGKKNPADFFSRHPLPYDTSTLEEKLNADDIENHVFLVTQHLPDAITTEDSGEHPQ